MCGSLDNRRISIVSDGSKDTLTEGGMVCACGFLDNPRISEVCIMYEWKVDVFYGHFDNMGCPWYKLKAMLKHNNIIMQKMLYRF